MKYEIVKKSQKFNRLTILKEIKPKIYLYGKRIVEKRYFNCLCSCGKKTNTSLEQMKSNKTKSCGCWSRDNARLRHLTHGLSSTKFYDVFTKIKSRCVNKNNNDYYLYGGRGIKCLWKNFEEFKKDMYKQYLIHKSKNHGTNTRIDRINNNGNYEKENCKWSTHKEQARNRRGNHLITFKKETKTLTEWSEELKINRWAITNRILIYGWSIKKAFTTPIKK